VLKAKDISERRACELVGIARSSSRYRPHPRDDGELAERLKKIARKRKRYGYRFAWALLRRRGMKVNHKRVWRVWKALRLQVPRPRRRRKRGPSGASVPCKALYPNHVWTYDFIHDWCEDGRRLKMLTVLDEFTRECLRIEVASSMRAGKVIEVLKLLFARRGRPQFLRSDNGPEFIAEKLKQWLQESGAHTMYIEPGKPWQNAFEESFHGSFRDECLNMESFSGLLQAAAIVERWRRHYNRQRPHSSLGYMTPAEFRKAWEKGNSGAPPPGPGSLALSGAPEGQEAERQDTRPCPSVRSPASALGSFSNGALSSERAVESVS
jgi:putative transposase